MIVEVLESFKVTEGQVYIGGTTIEVDRFGTLHPDVQKELLNKTRFFRLIDGDLPKKVRDAEEEKAQPEESSEPEKSKRTLPRKK